MEPQPFVYQIAAKELGKLKEHLLVRKRAFDLLLNELGHVVTSSYHRIVQVTYDGFKVDTEIDGDKEVTQANLT
jgi:hypothetical protein